MALHHTKNTWHFWSSMTFHPCYYKSPSSNLPEPTCRFPPWQTTQDPYQDILIHSSPSANYPLWASCSFNQMTASQFFIITLRSPLDIYSILASQQPRGTMLCRVVPCIPGYMAFICSPLYHISVLINVHPWEDATLIGDPNFLVKTHRFICIKMGIAGGYTSLVIFIAFVPNVTL